MYERSIQETSQVHVGNTHDDLDTADPSSTQDAYHVWTLYMAQLATSALYLSG